ncbi:serine/threonine-protein kinase VRK1-like [Acanthaster planci]|uniref:non-specific serine/threonine protein kinase n=1 Tax=Acanthaster planci TaxID=133434 RepID=A0A8B7YR14_ACAPL|nr:serine/threonine-protein kinase VRK1-like [Acanthaster planci]
MPRQAAKKAAPKKRGPRAYKLPDPIPQGEVLKDLNKKEWKLGPTIGQGGFGELYLADEATSSPIGTNARYVVKIEPKDNGPLYTEQAFYQRGAKADLIEEWKKKHKLAHLGVPKYIGAGIHTRGKTEFRFLVMERFGEDVWKKFLACSKRFTTKTAFTLGIQMLDSLEYLHSTGYAHADIKSANILLGYGPTAQDQVYLVDYGLAVRFCPNGEHREYKEDPRKAHDGTPEFTSIDAHKGVVPSRRGDLEILGYVVTQWLAGSLPWEHKISEACTDFHYITNQKKQYMSNIGSLMKACFPGGDHPVELLKYMEYVSKLKYEEVPDYKLLKKLFVNGIANSGSKANGKLDFRLPSVSARDTKPQAKKRKAVGGSSESPKKAAKVGRARRPVVSTSDDTASDQEPAVKPPVKGQRQKVPSATKPKLVAATQRPVAKSPLRSPIRSPVQSPQAKSPLGVKANPAVRAKPDLAKKSPGAGRLKGSKTTGTTTPTVSAGEIFTKRKRKTPVATATSSTQTSPGVKQTPKIKRKR